MTSAQAFIKEALAEMERTMAGACMTYSRSPSNAFSFSKKMEPIPHKSGYLVYTTKESTQTKEKRCMNGSAYVDAMKQREVMVNRRV